MQADTFLKTRTFSTPPTILDVFWLKDKNVEESDNLPDPDLFAQEIVVP